MSGIVKIGKCYSGLLFDPKTAPEEQVKKYRYPRVIQRMALATERAFNDLGRNYKLQRKLDERIERGESYIYSLRFAGYAPKEYEGRQNWLTFGIRYFDPPTQEYGDYRQAESLLFGSGKGINRSLLFEIFRVQATGIEDLSEELFSKLIGRVRKHYQDPSFEGISFIRVSDKIPFDTIETQENGSQGIVFSLKLLALESEESQPSLRRLNPPIPINPDGTPIKGK